MHVDYYKGFTNLRIIFEIIMTWTIDLALWAFNKSFSKILLKCYAVIFSITYSNHSGKLKSDLFICRARCSNSESCILYGPK